MSHYLKSSNEVIDELQSSQDGLSSDEASARIERYGANKLKEGKKESLIHKLFKQFAEPMTIILLVAAAVSAGLSIYAKEFPTDVIIIMAVVIINAVLGVVQESKAESAIESLKQMSAATSKVIRNGKQITLKSEDLVPGDIVILEAGDAVPADCRIIESASLKIEEAALTGESVPVNKISDTLKVDGNATVPLGDRKNMAYMGSTVVYGRGKAVVVGTGMDTEMGKIADALAKAEEGKTPLQMKLSQLSRILTWLVVGICVFIFGFSLVMSRIKGEAIDVNLIVNTFMIAISLAVAAIPEGLATVVTIVLSIGVTNMSNRSAIIRRMTAVETLGCTQIICSDKTGTLTQNKMTVVDHFSDDEILLATSMSLCSDAELDPDTNNAIGEPTECALVNYAYTLGLNKREQKNEQVRIGEVPFDSGRKMMTTVHRCGDALVQYTKGAPDEILNRCAYYLDGGKTLPMTDDKRAEILGANKAMADKALRVLASAYKNLTAEPAVYEPEALENDLCFIGLVGMIDPVRDEVKPAIDECRNAGIRPIMITGDHKDTAVAIALQLGIINDPSEAITGAELDLIPDEVFKTEVTKYSVYARVQPEHKTKIVNAWRALGKVTAMTGDGVNDAPSIKNADIGVGMGITGTDVTKNVADMILADDNFATIVTAVGEGRRVYDNIRKSIQFLLASNLSEVLSIFIATLFGFTIFKAPHLLFINLITDCFPALALGMESAEAGVMKRRPRDSKEGIFSGGVGVAVFYQGVIVTVLTLISYLIGRDILYAHHVSAMGYDLSLVGETFANGLLGYNASELGTSMAFLTISMCEICHSLNMRSLHGSIFTMKKQNMWLWGAVVASLLATTAVIEIPFFANAFGFARLDLIEYAVAMGLAISIIPIVEICKIVTRAIDKKKDRQV